LTIMSAEKPASPETAAAPLSTDELRQRAAVAKHVASSFGQIVTLLLRSPQDRKRPMEDLEWMVIPALQNGQFVVAEAQSKETGIVAPAAAVLWAMVSESVDERLSQNLDQPVNLGPQDWRSGSIPWIIAAFGDNRVIGGLLQQLATNVFKAEPAKIRTRGADGKAALAKLEPSGSTPAAAT
jgi:hemolysin-activating ACP:hemolysin acyltransferase